jgi:tetratricopeptide (TPR) repeat protein
MRYVLTQLIVLSILLGFHQSVYAQDPFIDSLKTALKNAKHDKVRCSILSELAENAGEDEWPIYNEQLLLLAEKNVNEHAGGQTRSFYVKHVANALNNKAIIFQTSSNNSTALKYLLKALKSFEEIKDQEGIANTLSNIGVLYNLQENPTKAIEHFLRALKIQNALQDKAGAATTLDYLGDTYKKIGNISKAIDLLHQSLKINEEIKNSLGIMRSYISIANLYSSQQDIAKALIYYNNSLKISKQLDYKTGMANAFHNMSTAYIVLKDEAKAIEFCEKSLEINEEINDKNGIASDIINLGFIYKSHGDFTKALGYYHKSLKIYEELNNKEHIAYSLSYICDVLTMQKKYDQALVFAERNLKISKELGYPDNIKVAASGLSQIYKKQKRFEEAFEMFVLEIRMRDSITNEETKKASIKKQFQYQYEKQAAADSLKHAELQKVKNAQLEVQRARLEQEQTQRYALYGGLTLVLAFLGFVFNRFRVTKKQKLIIEEQKLLVDKAYETLREKNKEVMDSIQYAKRIQRALMTPENYINKQLNRLIK